MVWYQKRHTLAASETEQKRREEEKKKPTTPGLFFVTKGTPPPPPSFSRDNSGGGTTAVRYPGWLASQPWFAVALCVVCVVIFLCVVRRRPLSITPSSPPPPISSQPLDKKRLPAFLSVCLAADLAPRPSTPPPTHTKQKWRDNSNAVSVVVAGPPLDEKNKKRWYGKTKQYRPTSDSHNVQSYTTDPHNTKNPSSSY